MCIKKFEAHNSSFYLTKDVIDDIFVELFDLGYKMTRFKPSTYEYIECPECHGEKEVECKGCYGDGKVHCEKCKDKSRNPCTCEEGYIECEDCLPKLKKKIKPGMSNSDIESIINKFKFCYSCEEGYKECPKCNGNGEIYCSSCNGQGGHNCESCYGRGITSCDTCDSDGEIRNSVESYLIEFDLKYQNTEDSSRSIFRLISKKQSEAEEAISSIEDRIEKIGYSISGFNFEKQDISRNPYINLTFYIEKIEDNNENN